MFFFWHLGVPPPSMEEIRYQVFCGFPKVLPVLAIELLLSLHFPPQHPNSVQLFEKNLFCCLSSRARQFNFASIQRMAAPNWSNNGGKTTNNVNLSDKFGAFSTLHSLQRTELLFSSMLDMFIIIY